MKNLFYSALLFLPLILRGAQSTFPATVDNSGALTNPTNVFLLGKQHFYGNGLVQLNSRIDTNSDSDILLIGDSVSGGGSQGYYDNIANLLTESFGNGKGGVSYGESSLWFPNILWIATNAAGATLVSGGPNYDVWWGGYRLVPNGGIVGYYATNQNTHTSFGIDGNVIFVVYQKTNSAGTTFKLQTNNAAGGAWADFQTGISSDNGGSAESVYLAFTNAYSAPTQVRVVGTAGGNTVVQFLGVKRQGLNGGMRVSTMAVGGTTFTNFTALSTNITVPVIKGINPSLILIKFLDDENVYSNAFVRFNPMMATHFPNVPVIFLDTHPQQLSSAELPAIRQDTLTYTNAIAKNYGYFNSRQYFGTFSNALSRGYTANSDQHLTAIGNKKLAGWLANWMDLGREGNKFSPGKLVLTIPGDSTSTQSSITNDVFEIRDQDGNVWISMSGRTMIGAMNFKNKVAIGQFNTAVFDPTEPLAVLGKLLVYYNGAGSDLEVQLGNLILDNGNAYIAGSAVITGLSSNGSLTIGPSGGTITNMLTGSANLDFPSTGPVKTSDLAITVTGCGTNDVVQIAVPAVCEITNTFYTAFPSNNTVWVRFHNLDTNTSQNPGPGVFKALVTRF